MISLLLLDLDGVIVFEMAPPYVKKLELVLLHDLLVNALEALGVPVVVLTHRSRAEAAVILDSAGLRKGVAGLMAAEDILSAAFAYGTPWQLLRKGLRKSWALPAIERRYQVDRKNMAFIDDRLDNIQDLVGSGVGIALHAPSGIDGDGSLISFDFGQIVHVLRDCHNDSAPRIVSIVPRLVAQSEWYRTGINTGSFAMSPFNRLRLFGRSLRNLLWGRPID
ncbi:HAD family hydrolase [Rhodopila sp.]|uniref:HAD family hydrolase n=1 Tax=Rhodopila sp. TaxID=2480087 RepID=UPI003D0D6276